MKYGDNIAVTTIKQLESIRHDRKRIICKD